MSASYIRTTYRVPAKRGMDIRIDGRPARIVGFAGARLRVRIDGRPGIHSAHPTWRIDYPEPAAGGGGSSQTGTTSRES